MPSISACTSGCRRLIRTESSPTSRPERRQSNRISSPAAWLRHRPVRSVLLWGGSRVPRVRCFTVDRLMRWHDWPVRRARKAPQDPRTSRCDYDDSDAARGAGHLARPDRHDRFSGADKSSRGNRARVSCVLLRADQGGQLGWPEGLLRRLAGHSQGLVNEWVLAAVGAKRQARVVGPIFYLSQMSWKRLLS